MTSARDSLGAVGEQAALARVFPRLPAATAALLGPGDDCAVLAAPDGRFVVTTDLMVEGPDFRLAWSTPVDLGWKAAASNLADVAAMGARPTGLVVALAAAASTPVAFLEGLADGLREACAALAPGCGVVGGDLSRSPTLTIAVTAFGDLEGRAPVRRSGARVGDVVGIAGRVGEAAAALAELFERASDSAGVAQPIDEDLRRRARAQLRPEPPIPAGVLAARAGATAMLDVSDGLALDAARIARASGVALDLDPGALGPDPERALAGGEDHALLATFPDAAGIPSPFRRVGRVVAGAGGVLLAGRPLQPRGWDPYRS
ncbi:MAG: thiamine-phosphate kinase [Microbacteriaceae bacterium]